MSDEWVSCGDFYRFLVATGSPNAAGLIQLVGGTGKLQGRAGKAVLILGNNVTRLTDWPMAPCLWTEAISFSNRLQGRYNAFRFDPLLSTIEASGYRLQDIGRAELGDDFHPLSNGQVQVSLSRIEINARDAADLGYFAPFNARFRSDGEPTNVSKDKLHLTQAQSDPVDVAPATTGGNGAKLLVPPASGKRQTPSIRKQRLRKFFQWADEPTDQNPPKWCLAGDKTILHRVYTDWINKQNGDLRTIGKLVPFEKTAFKKWLKDWNAGVRW